MQQLLGVVRASVRQLRVQDRQGGARPEWVEALSTLKHLESLSLQVGALFNFMQAVLQRCVGNAGYCIGGYCI
jgi:hypothetical protein